MLKKCEDCDYKKHRDTTEHCFLHPKAPDRCGSWKPTPLPQYANQITPPKGR